MTFENFLRILMKQWKLLLICFVFVGLGTFIGSKLLTPIYQSSALIQVAIRSSNSNNQGDYTNLLASDQLVQTEALLAVSNPVLREVASHYPDLSVGQLTKEATSTVKLNTQLFEIDVQDPRPTRAAALANDIAATLIKQQLQGIQQSNIQSQQQLQQDLNVTQQKLDDATTKLTALKAKGGNSSQIAILNVQLNGLLQHNIQEQTALAQLELTEAQNGDFLRLVQTGQPGLSPVLPNVLLNTSFGLLVGLLLGMLLAVMIEQLDTRVRTPEALSQLLGWPVLATIWQAKSSTIDEIFNPTGSNVNVEPYRILRTSIGFSRVDKPIHSLMVTSAAPRDGKSSIAANLAIFMAKAGKQTLLIDADLRRPTQHELFGLSHDKIGLSNAILAFSMSDVPNTPTYRMSDIPNTPTYRMPIIPKHQKLNHLFAPASQESGTLTSTNMSLEPFIYSVDIPNLWIMPTGPLPPNPSELLDSKAMQRFLSTIANCGVEKVIFDAPPLLGLSDANILSAKVDGVIVVVDTTRSTKVKLKQMTEALKQTGAHVIGCVVNKQRRNRDDSSYYYYYSTDEQKSEVNDAKNGHTPTVTIPPSLESSPLFEQGKRSN